MEFVVGVAVLFSPNMITFTILRFLLGTSNMGLFILGSVIGAEFLGPSKRVIGVMGMQMGFAIGYMMLALVAFLIRKWRIIQFVLCAPVVFFFLLMPIVPESPRWLMSQGKYNKAEKIIRKAAKVNGKKVPEPLFDEEDIKHGSEKLKEQPTVIDLFKTPNLRRNTINLMWNWFVNSIVYYGLSLNTGDLGGNEFISFFISGVVEVPAVIYAFFAIEWFGRRPNLAGTEILAGIACFATIVIRKYMFYPVLRKFVSYVPTLTSLLITLE
ncbi:organic cation transporter protein-like [Amphiura filiformis]|uniref:organic cation transporter protein-like n=1 Tax=Amphiura filiformis TaxID=82378 RepID=UPI003B2275AF